MMWETFRYPGATDQAMLPLQTSRNPSLAQRNSSLGQPLRQMDSNEMSSTGQSSTLFRQPSQPVCFDGIVPYTGKGKGRARDVLPNDQMFTAWEQAQMGSSGQFEAPTQANQSMPLQQQQQKDPPQPFVFAPERMSSSYTQPQAQQNMNPESYGFQNSQAQAHPHAHPQPTQTAHSGPSLQQQGFLQAQLPLQKAYQPPPGFPQRAVSPGLNFFPGSELQQLPVEQTQTQTQHLLDQPPAPLQPPAEQTQTQPPPQQPPSQASAPIIPMRTGYHYLPGRGFVCHVCEAVLPQMGIHQFAGYERLCWADGPVMQSCETIVELEPRKTRSHFYI